jgi:hypothetical protein
MTAGNKRNTTPKQLREQWTLLLSSSGEVQFTNVNTTNFNLSRGLSESHHAYYYYNQA